MDKLKGIRNENNLRQKDMAELLDISQDTYGMKERGEREFTVSEVNIILDIFPDYSYKELFYNQKRKKGCY